MMIALWKIKTEIKRKFQKNTGKNDDD